MLNFDRNGLLVPNLNIHSTQEELEEVFVKDIGSHHRRYLFDKYILYTESLKKELIFGSFFQWIDGSFVSKKRDPHDIDILTFVDYREFEYDSNRFEKFKYPLSLINFDIDGYIVVIYPEDHKNYPLYEGDRLYWMDLFNKTRRNKSGIKNQKGFLELNFNR